MDDNTIYRPADASLLYNTLLDIKGTSEATNALLTAHIDAFNKHVEEDAKLSARITNLEASHQRQAGFISAVAAIWGVIGTILGAIATFFAGRHFGG